MEVYNNIALKNTPLGVAHLSEVDRRLLRSTKIRFVDPASLLVAIAVEKCLKDTKLDHESVGIIATSQLSTISTFQKVYEESKTSIVSPLKFSAASPGTLAGLSCILFGLRGPSIHFTMPVNESSLQTSRSLANIWKAEGQAQSVILATVIKQNNEIEARCCLLTNEEGAAEKASEMNAFLMGLTTED